MKERGRKLSLSSSDSGRRIFFKKASRLILFSFKTLLFSIFFLYVLNTFIMTAFKSLFPKSNT